MTAVIKGRVTDATTKVYADSLAVHACVKCGQPVVKAVLANIARKGSYKRCVQFDRTPTVLREYVETSTSRIVLIVDFKVNHRLSCVGVSGLAAEGART